MRYGKFLYCTLILVALCFHGNARGEPGQFIPKVDKDGIQRVEVVASEYTFTPDYIIVKANVPVEITVRKEPSIVPHSFVMKAADAGMDIHESIGKEPKAIRFTPTKAGKYAFYCDQKLLFFKPHREKGMEGVLDVRD